MKVVDSYATGKRTSTEIDLFDEVKVRSPELRDQIKQQVGDYLLSAIQREVGHDTSPVSGEGDFKKLSPEYAAFKKKEVGNKEPNLELSGDMMNALDWRDTGSTKIEVGIFGDQAPKADGHNNLSGESQIPTRRFLPDVGQRFTSKIEDDVRQIIANAIADSNPFEPSDFSGVDTKAELYAVLSDVFDGLTRSEIRAAVLTNQDLLDMLKDEELLDLL